MFKDIADRPAKLLCDIYKFIGVNDDIKLVPRFVNIQVDNTQEYGCPQEYRDLLDTIFAREIQYLNDNYGCKF